MITLEYAGTEQSMSDWGFTLDSLSCLHRNLTTSVYRGFIPGASVSDTPAFAFEAKVIIRRNRTFNEGSLVFEGGYIAFIGYAMPPQAGQDGSVAGISYEFANAWYFLENTAFNQFTATRHIVGSVGTTVYTPVSELLLFTRVEAGVLQFLTNGGQIIEVIDFLGETFAAQGMDVPVVAGDVLATIPMPSYEAREMMCADVIRKCLELQPSSNAVFEYTTDAGGVPVTIFHVRPRISAIATSLQLLNGTDHKSLDIVKRSDLVPRAIIITYKVTATNDGQPWVSYLKDKYGPNGANHDTDPDNGLRVIQAIIELQGRITSTVSGSIKSRSVDAQSGTEATRIEWWKIKCPWLGNDKIDPSTLAILSATVDDGRNPPTTISLATYPNEIYEGTITPWMKEAPVNFNEVNATIKALCSFDVYTTSGLDIVSVKHRHKELSVQLKLTNATTGDYAIPAQTIEGETVPGLTGYDADGDPVFSGGIAQQMWEALEVVQYEGTDIRVQAEISNQAGDGPLVTLANTLNLTGGRAEWETMDAQIQAIEENDGMGYTQISFGPARHLGAGDLATIFQFSRPRRVWNNPAVRASGEFADMGSDVQLGDNVPKENSTDGGGTKEQISATGDVTYTP